jgi:tripartite ATP-independent transporter DctM subunit
MTVNPSLPAIPLFTLAGYFLAEGGASSRLVRVFRALVGNVRGGPAILTALICAFFTSFTGASGVTILALGGLLMPVLLSARYSQRNAIGLLTGAGSLGLMFPPALPLILYAVVATTIGSNVTLKQMFLAGLVPGAVLVVLTSCWGVFQAPRASAERRPFDPRELGRAAWIAKWELLLPVVSLVALFGGFATPVEAAAVTALYAFLIETLVYRDLKIRSRVPAVMAECGLLVGGVLLILGVAMGFTNYLVDAQIPDRAVEWVQGSIESRWVFLLTLNAFLLIVGCLMDIFSAIVVVVPLIVPVATAFGIDPVHLGIIFLANMELGYLTPPVGMNLFLSAYRFNKTVPEVIRAVIPMFLVLLLGVLLITYVPALSTTLPRWFG